MGAGTKVVVSGVSLVLLVAVVLGLVAAVGRSRHKVGADFAVPGGAGAGDGGFATTSKSLSAMCAATDYKSACEKSLGPVVGHNSSASIKEIVKAAMEVTVNASVSALEKAKALGDNATAAEPMQRAALSDCKVLLQDAVDELRDSVSSVNASDLHSLSSRAADVQTWLSAVISYQHTCLDGVEHPELKAQLEKLLVDVSHLTSNALAIISEVVDTFQSLSSLQIPMKGINMESGRRRRLLESHGGIDAEGYPSWFSQSDRRLLAAAQTARAKPNVVVAQDGSGNFKTITAALAAMPKGYRGRYVIYVKAGTYKENVIVDKDKVNVFMYGDGPRRTVVTGRKNYVDGTPTFQTATFAAVGSGFVAKSMGFQNTAGPEKHQAVALRVQSDMSAFFNCRMDGFQDTLYAQTHRQFYRNCVVSGTVDFIFGDSSAILQNCLLIVRRPMDNQQNIVTAHGRAEKREVTGLVIHNCRIVPDQRLFPDRFKIRSYLGRPWKQYSRTVIMESTIGDLIQPEGYMPWDGDFALKTLYYAEYGNRGPGARTAGRVRWPGFRVIGRREASQFTVGPFIQGNQWLRNTGAPYILGFRH